MKKPRILIAIHYMEIGGAEISLIGLLQALDYERVDVDLFVYAHRGELMPLIPAGARLLPQVHKYTTTELPLRQVLKMGYFDVAAARILAKVKYSLFRRKHPSDLPDDSGLYQCMARHVTPLLPKIKPEVEYDLAVNFCGMHEVVLDKVRARRKAAWIHTDYTKVATDRHHDLLAWQRFDRIVSISPQVTESFVKVYPLLAPKIVEIENMLSPAFVRTRAEEFYPPEFAGGVTILTIGRYVNQKNFDNLPLICRELIELMKLLSVGRYSAAKNYDNVPDITRRLLERLGPDGENLRWYIIGYGDDGYIRQAIARAGMEKHVILLGKRTNPYPYIKACDIYVQPSRYEGKSVTVREAQMLGRPVVVTDYPTAASQIRNGVDGIIVPMDNEGCARGLADFIADDALRLQIQQNLKTLDFGNMAEVEKFYSLCLED